MRTFLRHVLLPAVLATVAIGVSFKLGRWQQEKLGEADAIARAPLAPLLKIGPHRPANVRSTQDYLSRAEAEAELTDVLNGYRPPGVRDPVFNILRQMKLGEGLALAVEWPELQVSPMLLRQMAMNWARQDTKAALEWAGTLSPEDAQTFYRTILAPPDYMASVGVMLPQVDAKIAAQYFDKLTNPNDRNQAVSAITAGLTRTDPAAALDWLGQHATGDLYAKTATTIFKTLVAPELRTLDIPEGAFAMPTTGQSNPAAAVALLAKVNDPAVRTSAIGEIAAGWAQSDPAAAAKWAADLPSGDNTARTAALNTIVTGWAVNDPAAAAAFMEKSGNAAGLLSSAPTVADALAKYDADGAWQFGQNLPAGVAKDQALNNVLVNLAATDFSTAWDFAGSLPAGAGRDAALTSLVAARARQDPAQAQALLAQFSDASARQIATRALANTWAAQDPQATGNWINTLPAGDQHDAAVYELVPVMADQDPAAALNWTNTLTDSSDHANFARWVLLDWATKDPAAALAAVPSAQLTDEQKAALTADITQLQARAK